MIANPVCTYWVRDGKIKNGVLKCFYGMADVCGPGELTTRHTQNSHFSGNKGQGKVSALQYIKKYTNNHISRPVTFQKAPDFGSFDMFTAGL